MNEIFICLIVGFVFGCVIGFWFHGILQSTIENLNRGSSPEIDDTFTNFP